MESTLSKLSNLFAIVASIACYVLWAKAAWGKQDFNREVRYLLLAIFFLILSRP